ncbi:glutathione ABC transporter permease GsiD [Pseudonocardia sulfidoxydans NBRC 16205]|uniref:Glutathione ABC transporter permease GsiD n=1 Tax=Pseudonocardia sulfidoxydans NBRC 16205 TaxID=1223511 RepID=A0A511D8T1_9PSEU|nr:ABC transporter permease [Pseudonocardia sulfidoxydans]GEL21209.1 glutathione ABC transporter permease GsiD [Pseudonocardia sulfidoxydans NBRC 16205]
MTVVDAPEPASARARSPMQVFTRRVLRSKVNLACLVFLGLVVVCAVFAPLLAPFDPNLQHLDSRYLPPFSGPYVFGTDDLGRDVLSRALLASRVSVVAPLISVGVALTLGVSFGLAAGYVGGWVDSVLSRLADAVNAIPALVLALAVIAVLGPGLVNAMLAVGLASAPRLFRVVRGATLAVREETYIEAATVVGCSSLRTVAVHVLPNVRSPLLVQTSLLMSFALLAEASLSFLGLGIQPPEPSWGAMLRTAFEQQFLGPWLVVVPGLLIMCTVLSFNLLGDGIRDAIGRERGTR